MADWKEGLRNALRRAPYPPWAVGVVAVSMLVAVAAPLAGAMTAAWLVRSALFVIAVTLIVGFDISRTR